jgi:hypothetical protein
MMDQKKTMQRIEEATKNLENAYLTLERLSILMDGERENVEEEREKSNHTLKLFCHQVELFSKTLNDFPELVDERLEQKMERHLSKTTDHVFKEMERAADHYTESLRKVSNSCEAAVARLKVRLGWQDYLPPALLGLLGFFAAFSLVWYFELGVAKVDIETLGEASRMRALYYSATPAERRTVSKILNQYLPRR